MADFDLGANTQVPLTAVASDANGNAVTLPTRFNVDDTTVLTVTDNNDGTAVAIRASVSGGKATITAVVTNPDGSEVTGILAITVAAQSGGGGNAVSVEIIPGVPS